MRIRKIELRNHPILSNLELDFTDEHGQSIETIIFAGENGTGKTAILDLLYEFSMFDLSNEKRDEKRIFEIELLDDELGVLRQNVNYKHL
jgi:predicted ATP-binding protein involved in virulence